jgi:hypothetical protein
MIKHVTFSEKQASRLLSPKGQEILTKQLVDIGTARISSKLTLLFNNMIEMPLAHLAGAAALLFNETLAGPIEYILSESGLNSYYVLTRNHVLEVEAVKIVMRERLSDEPPDVQQMLYFATFGSLVADADEDIIHDHIITPATVMVLIPYFMEEHYAKYENFTAHTGDMFYFIWEHLNMSDRKASSVFSKPAILAFSSVLASHTDALDKWVEQNIPEEDRIGFISCVATKLQDVYEQLLDIIDWPI